MNEKTIAQLLKDLSGDVPVNYLYVLVIVDPKSNEFTAIANMEDEAAVRFLQEAMNVMKSNAAKAADPDALPKEDITREIDLGADEDE